MAPPQLYERPNVQLLGILRMAKARGMSFGEAWVEAIRPGKAIVMTTTPAAPALAIRWPTDRADREAWRKAITGSRETWRRAFYNMDPLPRERALLSLAATLERLAAEAEAITVAEGIGAERQLVSVA